MDENGLGPRLGPLLASAVAVEVSRYDREALEALGAEVGIGDSKAVSAFGHMAHAEGVVLALVEQQTGRVPEDADALIAAVSLDGPLALRAPCPRASAPQCWSVPLPLPVFGGDVEAGRRALRRLARAGVKLRRARSAIACVRVFNEALASRGSKLAVDLWLFERLLLDARASLGELEATCGMVGGIRRYAPRFEALGRASEVICLEEVKGRSAYRVDGFGEVAFEVKADARHLPVGLASMLGKYLREIAMRRQGDFYRGQDPSLPAASGYHDPVTARFVEASAPLRARLGVDPGCFERNR